MLLDDGRYALPAAPISDADAGTLGLYSGWFATKLRPGCGLHSSDHPYGESLWGIPMGNPYCCSCRLTRGDANKVAHSCNHPYGESLLQL